MLKEMIVPLSHSTYRNILIRIGLSISLLIIAPASIFTLYKKNLYFGYLGMSIYHNPTYILLKPLSLMLFIFSLQVGKPTANKSLGVSTILLAMCLTIFGILAKPNYIIALLPALGLFCLFRLFCKKPIDWKLSILGIFVPALLLLSWQYFATYTDESVLTDRASIIFAPFLVYSREYDLLLLKFFLSILFPLTVYLIYFKIAKKDTLLNLAWLIFVFGIIYTYLFAETGVRLQDANFGWSGDITMFILFVCSTIFFLQQWLGRVKEAPMVKTTFLPWAAFSLHLLSGILWYFTHIADPIYPWW